MTNRFFEDVEYVMFLLRIFRKTDYTYITASAVFDLAFLHDIPIPELPSNNSIEYILENYPEHFRLSKMCSNDGKKMYMYNSRFSYFIDLWNTFCYINSVKYG